MSERMFEVLYYNMKEEDFRSVRFYCDSYRQAKEDAKFNQMTDEKIINFCETRPFGR